MGSSLGRMTVWSRTHMLKTLRRVSNLQKIIKHFNLGFLLNNLRNRLIIIKAKKKYYNNNAIMMMARRQ